MKYDKLSSKLLRNMKQRIYDDNKLLEMEYDKISVSRIQLIFGGRRTGEYSKSMQYWIEHSLSL
jgi:hypothetical protein